MRILATATGAPATDTTVGAVVLPIDGAPSAGILAVGSRRAFLGQRASSGAVSWTEAWTKENLPSEIGTFTPVVLGGTVAGSGAYSFVMGRYTRIGNRVLFVINIVWTGHTGTGRLQVTLPFISQSIAGNAPPVSVLASNLTFSGSLSGLVSGGTNYLIIRESKPGAAYTDVTVAASGTLIISGQYEI
jgi:hypothetical protein